MMLIVLFLPNVCLYQIHFYKIIILIHYSGYYHVAFRVYEYSGTSILRASELRTPPLYGRLAGVPDACPLLVLQS